MDDFDEAQLSALREEHGGALARLAEILHNLHVRSVGSILARVMPEKEYQSFRFDASTYTAPLRYQLRGRIGGVWVHNPSTKTVHVYAGDPSGLSLFDVAPGTWASFPIGTDDAVSIITVTVDAGAAAATVRVLLSSEPQGPAEGSIAS